MPPSSRRFSPWQVARIALRRFGLGYRADMPAAMWRNANWAYQLIRSEIEQPDEVLVPELPDLAAIAARKVVDPILQGRYDLDAPIDTRQLFKAVLYDHLQLDPRLYDDIVFPGSADKIKLPGMFN